MQFSATFTDSQMDIDPQAPENGDIATQNPRKRPAGEMDAEDEGDVVDQLIPAAAAMKRRRIEEEQEAARAGKSTLRPFGHIQEEAIKEKPKKLKKEVNIKEVVRERREEQENAARREEEDLREDMDGIDVEGMRNLVVVEEMQLPDPTERPQSKQNAGSDSRWDDRWNGRKNFKKFRRQGEGVVRRGQSLIVPLEEVKKKDYGIGEEYWLESSSSKKKHKAKDRASQSQSQPFTIARTLQEEDPVDLDGEDTPGAIDIETLEQSTNRSSSANGKRPAPDRGKGAAAKKQKKFAIQESESESEEDELKFRFKKRR